MSANPHVNVRMHVYIIDNTVFCGECANTCSVEHADHKIKVQCHNKECYQYDRPGRFPRVTLDGFDAPEEIKI